VSQMTRQQCSGGYSPGRSKATGGRRPKGHSAAGQSRHCCGVALDALTCVGALHFASENLTAALKAVAAAGHVVARVEITPEGRIVIITVRPGDDQPTAQNALDKWLAKHAGTTEGH
jgi:hypothetical protein